MSLNGECHVMRHGRCTSQISIYNYPEHLNPFYEDDQHKRLRFWNINKNNEFGSRRSSFSLSGLKDIWAFKSFKLKKKSSTLGINKTSESPPILRRQICLSTDSGIYTKEYPSQPSSSGNNFQRNTSYRSSLQNISSKKDSTKIELDRNDNYRRTFQGKLLERYTPEVNTLPAAQKCFKNRQYRSFNFDKETLQNGISQVIDSRSNPFESSDEENGSSSKPRDVITFPTKSPRKKRQAPAPPNLVPDSAGNTDSLLHTNHQTITQDSLHISENSEIADLTAQIENFVKNSSNEKENTILNVSKKAHLKNESSNKNELFIQEDSKQSVLNLPMLESNKIDCKDKQILKSIDCKSGDVDENSLYNLPSKECILETNLETEIVPFSERLNQNRETKPKSAKLYIQENKENEIGTIECIHVHMKNLETPIKKSELTSFQSKRILSISEAAAKRDICSTKNTEDNLEFSNEDELNNVRLTKESRSKELLDNYPNFSEPLTEDSISTANCFGQSAKNLIKKNEGPISLTDFLGQSINQSTKLDDFDALQCSKINSNLTWKKSTLAPLEEHVPPQKRKSVKDIIENINRNQRLLKVHKENSSTVNLDKPFTLHTVKKYSATFPDQCNLESFKNNLTSGTVPKIDPQKLENTDILKKCTEKKELYQNRESSPTSSNLDWNPLPKPKRTKNTQNL